MSTKCDNCYDLPDFVINDFGSRAQYFCKAHLPSIYNARLKAGVLTKWTAPEAVAEAVVETPVADETVAKKASKKAKKAVAEAVAEEPAVEDVVEAVAEEAVDEQNTENSDEAGSSSTVEGDADAGTIS